MEYVPSSSFAAEILPFLIAVWMTFGFAGCLRACPMVYMGGSVGFCFVRIAVLQNGNTNARRLNGGRPAIHMFVLVPLCRSRRSGALLRFPGQGMGCSVFRAWKGCRRPASPRAGESACCRFQRERVRTCSGGGCVRCCPARFICAVGARSRACSACRCNSSFRVCSAV